MNCLLVLYIALIPPITNSQYYYYESISKFVVCCLISSDIWWRNNFKLKPILDLPCIHATATRSTIVLLLQYKILVCWTCYWLWVVGIVGLVTISWIGGDRGRGRKRNQDMISICSC